MRIALGLDLDLEEFAVEHGASTFRVWGEGDNWRRRLHEVASDPGTTVCWNLSGVDVSAGLLRSISGRGGGTDWELAQFYRNDDWLSRTVWYREGVKVHQPEEMS